MKKPSEAERDGFATEAQRRSGSDIVLEYPVEAAGITVYLCRLSDDDWRDAMNALTSPDAGTRETGRNVALARARVWPDQETVSAACADVPMLREHLWDQVERLAGASAEFRRVVDVTPSLDDSAVLELGIDPARLNALRRAHPNPKTLKIASYRDDEMGIAWACVLKLPSDAARRAMLQGLADRGHECSTTYAIASLVEPPRDGEASVKFVRGEHRIAAALWPPLYAWADTAAAARPTILRPRSKLSATPMPQPMSSPKS